MLSISARGSAASAESYYDHLAEQDDYYLKGEEPPGQWLGEGAQALGLSGSVSKDAFGAVLRGYQPGEGPDGSLTALVQNAGDKHMAGWDLTFSAPKSVSVLWALQDANTQKALAAAHDDAVRDALKFVEEKAAFTRRGKAGAMSENTKGLVISAFQHGTSREQDPQLHTHCFVHNVARREDNSWGSIDGRHFYRWKMAAGAYYRVALAEKMQELGFQVERDGKSFQVEAVPEKVTRHFSKRRAQIEEVLERLGATGAKASATVTLKTRKAKTAEDRAALMDRWKAEAAELGYVADEGQAKDKPELLAMKEDRELLESLTAQESTFTEQKIWEAIATEAQGAMGVRELTDKVKAMQDHQSVLGLRKREIEADQDQEIPEKRYTTQDMRQLEQSMLDAAERMHKNTSQQVTPEALGRTLAARPTLTDEQVNALRRVTTESGSITLVRGMAGTGKSYMLDAAREVWQESGYRVRGVALQGKTAQDLQDSTRIESSTLHSFLRQIRGTETAPAREVLSSKDVIVVEEAGMIGSRQWKELLDLAEQSGAKVVAVGDHQQLQPIDAGGAYKAIQSRIGAADLTGIRRQKEQWMRQAVKDLAIGKSAEALAAMDKAGRVHIEDDAIGAKAGLIQAWAGSQAPIRERVMLARTNEDVQDLNALARHILKAEGALGEDVAIPGAGVPLSVGERVRFTRNDYDLDVRNGTTGTVTRLQRDYMGNHQVIIETDGGRVVQLEPNPAESPIMDYAYATTVHKSQGMTVDESYLLITPGVDREWSYVGLSRARQAAHVYMDQEALDVMRDAIPPTEKMLAFAESVAAKEGLTLPEDASSSFQVCRDFLNEHAHVINNDKFVELADAAREAARHMAQSHAKDTSMDYEILEKRIEAALTEKAPEPREAGTGQSTTARLEGRQPAGTPTPANRSASKVVDREQVQKIADAETRQRNARAATAARQQAQDSRMLARNKMAQSKSGPGKGKNGGKELELDLER